MLVLRCVRRVAVHFQEHRVRSAGSDVPRMPMQQRAVARGTARDRQRRVGILQHQRNVAILPCADLLADALPHERRADGSAVEQDRVDTGAIPEKVRKMPGDGAVRGVGKAPLLQRALQPVGPRCRIAGRKEPIEQQPLDVRPCQRRRLRAGHHRRPASGHGHDEPLVGRSVARQDRLLQVAARGDETVPLRAGHLPASAGKARFGEVCEGQIDVVATEEDVVADCHP